MQEKQIPFVLLTHDEFARLSTDEKVMYLARAMEAMAQQRGVVFASRSSQATHTLQ